MLSTLIRFGNKYFENLEEQPGRHRWIDYAAHDYNIVQVEPQWHSWLHHIRQDPPNVDPIMQAAHKTWEIVSISLFTPIRIYIRWTALLLSGSSHLLNDPRPAEALTGLRPRICSSHLFLWEKEFVLSVYICYVLF